MNKQLLMAINQICAERNLRPQVVTEAVEQALVSAYRRHFNVNASNVEARLNPETGDVHIYARKEVVPVVTDSRTQISVEEAARIDPHKARPGEHILVECTPENFGRIAAQTAKQVILQRIREAERDAVYDDYAEREGELIQGVVRSIDHQTGTVIVSLDGGRAEGILERNDQIPGERYKPNTTITAYVSEVSKGTRGPVIRLSRSHRNMLRRLLEKEVPEIKQGVVEIKAIAREAGSRSKVAVHSNHPGVDPVGSCVGMRGVRIQNIVNELNNEKIDIIEWHPDPERFVANALSPARVSDVLLFPEHDRTAVVIVPNNQLSLAIGKEGQNARLVAKLTGWRIDIKNESEAAAEGLDEMERQRLRKERKERVRSDDLLEAARRILAQQEEAPDQGTAPLPTPAEGPAFADDLLARVVLPEEEAAPDLETLLTAVETSPAVPTPPPAAEAPTSVKPPTSVEPLDVEAAEKEEDMRALAAKLAMAMTSFDSELSGDFEADRQALARLFAEDEEDRAKTGGKKKRKKGRGEVKPMRPLPGRVERRGRGGHYEEYDDEYDE
jgi:N utilization substance protein A